MKMMSSGEVSSISKKHADLVSESDHMIIEIEPNIICWKPNPYIVTLKNLELLDLSNMTTEMLVGNDSKEIKQLWRDLGTPLNTFIELFYED